MPVLRRLALVDARLGHAAACLEALVGQTLPTVIGRQKLVVRVEGACVVVGNRGPRQLQRSTPTSFSFGRAVFADFVSCGMPIDFALGCDSRPQRPARGQDARIAIYRVIDLGQHHPAWTQDLYAHHVADSEPCLSEHVGRNRHLVLGGNATPRFALLVLGHIRRCAVAPYSSSKVQLGGSRVTLARCARRHQWSALFSRGAGPPHARGDGWPARTRADQPRGIVRIDSLHRRRVGRHTASERVGGAISATLNGCGDPLQQGGSHFALGRHLAR
jgi:hypothetical protein